MSAERIKELRALTGAGFLDCKKALAEAGGDLQRAIDLLREKGLADAAKKSGRVTAEGAVGCYVHGNGKIGVMVEVNCETDFVAKTDEFKALVHDICLHVAASNPKYVSRDEVDAEVLEKERQILYNQAINEGKKPDIAERLLPVAWKSLLMRICLLEQPFVKNPDITVKQLIQEKIAKFGENITLRRFARFEMGEGLQKRQDDFAAEVAKLQQK